MINRKAKVQALIIVHVHVTGYGNVVIRQVTQDADVEWR